MKKLAMYFYAVQDRDLCLSRVPPSAIFFLLVIERSPHAPSIQLYVFYHYYYAFLQIRDSFFFKMALKIV